MMKAYRLVVFDWEGTLGDTLGKVLNVLKVESARLHFGKVDEAVARRMLPLGFVAALKTLFPEADSEKRAQLHQVLQSALASRSTDVYLLPGAKTLVQALYESGVVLGIATNRGQGALQRDLQASALNSYFTVTRSAGQLAAKPAPDMLKDIMRVCGEDAEHTLMVGDSVSDMEMAAALNVDAVGVQFYDQPEQAEALWSAGALEVFDDYRTLLDYLQLNHPRE